MRSLPPAGSFDSLLTCVRIRSSSTSTRLLPPSGLRSRRSLACPWTSRTSTAVPSVRPKPYSFRRLLLTLSTHAALGHPLAASGARITNHLVHNLHRLNKRYAVGSACIGGGQACSIVLERV